VELSGKQGALEDRVAGGAVIGMRREDVWHGLRIPIVSRDAALVMALAESRLVTGRSTDVPVAAEFAGGLSNEGRLFASWTVMTGTPIPGAAADQAQTEFGIAGEVDTLTGEVLVTK